MVKLFSKNSNLCDHNSPTLQSDRQTDRQTTCDRNTALCTKVHRAVKNCIFFAPGVLWLWSPQLVSALSCLDNVICVCLQRLTVRWLRASMPLLLAAIKHAVNLFATYDPAHLQPAGIQSISNSFRLQPNS